MKKDGEQFGDFFLLYILTCIIFKYCFLNFNNFLLPSNIFLNLFDCFLKTLV